MKVIAIRDEAAQPAGQDRFVGQVHVQPLLVATDGVEMTVVHFSPNARTYLHTHDSVQVIYCIRGQGILATKEEKSEVTPGMVVQIPARHLHWHGAVGDNEFVQISIRPPGETHWTDIDPLEPREG